MEFTDSENIPGVLIFIDFKRAFDTLDGIISSIVLKHSILARTLYIM